MDKISAARAGAQFEGLLVAQMLAPLDHTLGGFGSFALAPLAQSIAAHDVHGFGSLLAAIFEKRDAK